MSSGETVGLCEAPLAQASIRECTSREPQRRSFEALRRALTYTGVVPVRPAIASAPHATRTAIAIRSKTQICQVFTAATSARHGRQSHGVDKVRPSGDAVLAG